MPRKEKHMAKCVENPEYERVIRVSNERAEYLVAIEDWRYANKQTWKQQGRRR